MVLPVGAIFNQEPPSSLTSSYDEEYNMSHLWTRPSWSEIENEHSESSQKQSISSVSWSACGMAGPYGHQGYHFYDGLRHATFLIILIWMRWTDDFSAKQFPSRRQSLLLPARRVGRRRYPLPRLRVPRVLPHSTSSGTSWSCAMFLWLMVWANLLLPCMAATDPVPDHQQQPSGTLQTIIEQFQTPTADLEENHIMLHHLFTCTANVVNQHPAELIQLHSYKPGLGRRSTFTTRAQLGEGLQRLRERWQEFPDLAMAAVIPAPPPLETFAPEQTWVVWEPVPIPWTIGLWDIRTAEHELLERKAISVLRQLTLRDLLRQLGLFDFCTARPSPCRWYCNYGEWLLVDVFPVQLHDGFYVQLQLTLEVTNILQLWEAVAETPPRPPPPVPPHMLRPGEASHPGPTWWVGTVNPTGLRGKEAVLATLPEGIWGVAETHLSGVSMTASVRALQTAAKRESKAAFVLPGAAVALRARSDVSGTWAGVLLWTAGVPQHLHLPWPNAEYHLGRVQAATIWLGPIPVRCLNLYGWSRGPTWPKAVQATNSMLQQVTQEFVLSQGGYRVILGDFNLELSQMPCAAIWRSQGWIEAQEWAWENQQQEIEPTCKGKTRPDMVFISPELRKHLIAVRLWDIFSDHRPLGVALDLPLQEVPHLAWPLPQEVPWLQVELQQWKQANMHPGELSQTPHLQTEFAAWCNRYEDSFTGYVGTPSTSLQPLHRGRGQLLAPTSRPAAPPVIKPSRPGERRPASAALCREVLQWFQQLRRLQSLCQALRAQKDTIEAQLYRMQLWQCIRRAKGFNQRFEGWWPQRPHRCQGSPQLLPEALPTLHCVEIIFEDFEINYRKLESWHCRRRRELLEVSFRDKTSKLFASLKPVSRNELNHLISTSTYTIVSVNQPGTIVTTDNPLPMGPQHEYFLGPHTAQISLQEDGTYLVDTDGLLIPGFVITVHVHKSTVQEIQEELKSFWEPRWCKHPAPNAQDWSRILAFARAHLPPGQLPYSPISLSQWAIANKRYKQTAARGPDGFSRLDLLHMPTGLVHELLSQVALWEERREWPDALRNGFVFGLPKRLVSQTAGDFRPVVIYSIIYRSWSSIRARAFLRHLNDWAGHHQYGYLPEAETTELWYLSQALIERAVQGSEPLMGLVMDLEKAFESIPRQPIRELALWLGMPAQIIDL